MNIRQLFLSHVAQTSPTPLMLEIEKAEGVYMFDTKGNKILDLISGIGVSNIGHRHPSVLKAIHDQTEKYLHLMVYGEFIQSPQVELAKALSDTLPENLNSVYFVNSGSEAVEGAMKLAKRHTGRQEIVAFKNAYHGSTHGSLSLNGNEDIKRNYRPLLPGIKHLEFGNPDQLQEINSKTAAVIIETVQGEAGVKVTDKSYFQSLAARCQEMGVLLIADEIQCGFGRTGTFWAFEQFGFIPDILVAAKGMGGGLPIGAFISSSDILSVLTNNPILGHITTFGGHPLSCAASLATLRVIQEESLLEQVKEKENLFRSLLKHPKIKNIRSQGLMMAVDFGSFEILKPIIDRGIEAGILTDWFLFENKSMRIAPPLTITETEIREACRIILSVID